VDTQRRNILAGVLILGLFGVASCNLPKLRATGPEDEILVFADDTTWQSLEPTLRMVFEDTVYTPTPETWFTVRRVDFGEWAENETHVNRIIVGTLDGDGPVSRSVQGSLDTTVRTLVENGQEFFFARYDSKAREQLLMFLVAPTHRDLAVQMRSRAPDLVYYFKSLWLKRELTDIDAESRYHKRDISGSLLRNNAWTMTIQHDYFVARDTSAGRFFWVRRANPEDLERWIFVAWWDSSSPAVMDEAWIRAARDSVTRTWMRTVDDNAHVEIAPYNLSASTVNFRDRFAYELRGNWRFSDKSGGGPFINITVYNERDRRIYMLDGSIFAPRVEKKKLIMQVEALLHTFRTSGELPEGEWRALLEE